MRTMRLLICGLGLLAAAFGADVTGKWVGDMPGRGGDTTSTTFTSSRTATRLWGSMTGPQGDIAIKDGKVAGDQISFDTTLEFNGTSIKLLYKGTVAGDSIKMTREREGSGQPREFTIKKAKT